MKVKSIIPRASACRDVDQAIDYYLSEASAEVASGFIDALEQAYLHISRHPSSGSTRYSLELSLPGLRTWSLSHYPYLIFYVERPDHVDIWRVLHGLRDIPAWMQDPELP